MVPGRMENTKKEVFPALPISYFYLGILEINNTRGVIPDPFPYTLGKMHTATNVIQNAGTDSGAHYYITSILKVE